MKIWQALRRRLALHAAPGRVVGVSESDGSHTLAWADITDNKQYISTGNADDENRVSLFLTDCPNQRRLRIMGSTRTVEQDEPYFDDIIDGECDALAERALSMLPDLKYPKH